MKFKELIAAIVICELAGFIGSVFTFSSIPTWYAYLVKPTFSPPNWVFGPVWTALYALMGIAAYLVYETRKTAALKIFGIQLCLNTVWSVVFFGFHSPLGGLVIIILLWLSIVWTILEFFKVSRPAAYLLAPYLFWVSFASVLNYYILMLN
jgi:translocator protein